MGLPYVSLWVAHIHPGFGFNSLSVILVYIEFYTMYAARFKTSGPGRRFRSVPDRADVFGQPLQLYVCILCMLPDSNEKTETASITSKIRRQAWHTSLISYAAEKTEFFTGRKKYLVLTVLNICLSKTNHERIEKSLQNHQRIVSGSVLF